MLYHGAQRVKLPNFSKIPRLLSPLAIFLRFQAFQRYMIGDVVFWWKVDPNFGHFAAPLECAISAGRLQNIKFIVTLLLRIIGHLLFSSDTIYLCMARIERTKIPQY